MSTTARRRLSYVMAIGIVYTGGAYYGWQSTLDGRREQFQRLAAYYQQRSTAVRSPQHVARYKLLSRKYENAAWRPWTMRPPKNPEL